MAKPNHLLNHFLDPKNWDRRSPVSLPTDPSRLQLAYDDKQGDWNTVVGYISGLDRWPVTWFPDTNVAILDATTPVWQALRIAALGVPNGSTVISGVVEAEMSEWLSDPRHNRDRAHDIKTAMDNDTWIRKFRMGPSHPLNAVLYSYTHLLGFRRWLAQPLPDGTTLLGTVAANRSGTMNEIRNKVGARAGGLAKKGRKNAKTGGKINISDEMHCVMAILYALLARRDTVILTADMDYLEIFYKAQWFLDTHYRGWLAAKSIKAGQYGTPAKEIQDDKGYFKGPLTLYRRPTKHMREVLPADQRSVRAGVLYIGPDGGIHLMRFPFELKMLEMLQTRAATGRCTDRFDNKNIHIDLGPLKPRLDGLYLGVGADSTIDFKTNGVCSSLGRLDLEHSICCFERFIL